MTALKLKLDITGRVIRSIGGEPNGILCGSERAYGERPGFAVTPNWSPTSEMVDAAKQGPVAVDMHDDGTFDVIPISTEDVVAAAADSETAFALWTAAVGAFQVACGRYLPKMAVEGVGAHLIFLTEVRDALADAGYIREAESGSGR